MVLAPQFIQTLDQENPYLTQEWAFGKGQFEYTADCLEDCKKSPSGDESETLSQKFGHNLEHMGRLLKHL